DALPRLDRQGPVRQRFGEDRADGPGRGGVDDVPHLGATPGRIVEDRAIGADGCVEQRDEFGEPLHTIGRAGGDRYDGEAVLAGGRQGFAGAFGEPALGAEERAVQVGGDHLWSLHRSSIAPTPNRGNHPQEAERMSEHTSTVSGSSYRRARSPLMSVYDLKREFKKLYAPKNTRWELVEVPQQRFIALDGQGDPNTAETYAHAVEALYTVAYTLKFAAKREGSDFVVGPLEGLWWSDRPEDFTARAKGSWQWSMMICLPRQVSDESV